MDIISIPASLFYRDTEIKIVRRGHNILTLKVSQQVREKENLSGISLSKIDFIRVKRREIAIGSQHALFFD